jgi:hypothetical protein
MRVRVVKRREHGKARAINHLIGRRVCRRIKIREAVSLDEDIAPLAVKQNISNQNAHCLSYVLLPSSWKSRPFS